MQEIDGGFAVDAAHVGFGLFSPSNLLGHCFFSRGLMAGADRPRGERSLAHSFKIGHGESEFGQHFFVRNRLVVLEPFAGFGDGALFFVADLFIFGGRICQGAGNRIEHDFEQAAHGGEFFRGQDIEHRVRLLALLCEIGRGEFHCFFRLLGYFAVGHFRGPSLVPDARRAGRVVADAADNGEYPGRGGP
jgi:hypothetical protein